MEHQQTDRWHRFSLLVNNFRMEYRRFFSFSNLERRCFCKIDANSLVQLLINPFTESDNILSSAKQFVLNFKSFSFFSVTLHQGAKEKNLLLQDNRQ